MKKIYRNILLVLLGIFILIQFIPVDRSNPKSEAEIFVAADVKTILKNSCYDCHSNQTVWPWYSYVAPVSWLVSNDVNEGREHLNFSNWEKLNAKKKAHKLDEIWEHVEKDEMPLPIYTFMHPSAKLTIEQKAILKNLTRGSGKNSFSEHEEIE